MAFQKGQSGNPGGRPPAITEIVELARRQSSKAIEALVAIMQDGRASPAARVSAACAILDRALGKPPQSLHYADDEPAVSASDAHETLRRKFERIMELHNEGKGPNCPA